MRWPAQVTQLIQAPLTQSGAVCEQNSSCWDPLWFCPRLPVPQTQVLESYLIFVDETPNSSRNFTGKQDHQASEELQRQIKRGILNRFGTARWGELWSSTSTDKSEQGVI